MNRLVVGLAATITILLAPAPRAAAQGQDGLLKNLNPTHPRLIALPADLDRVERMIAQHEQPRRWLEALRTRARRLLTQEPVKYELRGPRLLHVSRKVLDRVYTLALLYRLEGDRQYADRAIRELLTVSAFKDWHPAHFLDTAEMTHAVAIGYDWLYDVLSPPQRRTLREAIVKKGLQPALQAHRKKTWWTRCRHNWNQVCNGGITIGALAIAGEEPELAAEVLKHTLAAIRLPMAEYAPDGGWAEGPGYWHYATSYNVAFLAALESALGTDFDLAQLPGFAEAGNFRLHSVGPLGLTFNYADAGAKAGSAPEMSWLAAKFDRPIYAWHQRQSAGNGSPLDLIWFDPRGAGPRTVETPPAAHFRGVEVVFLRSAWEHPDAAFVGFKGGDNRANHSHLDLGSFVLDALGQRWALDLGGDNYNMPGYFGKQRFTYYRLKTEGHNTLLINGQNQNPRAKAPIVSFASRPERAFAVADLSAAYEPAGRVWRGIALLDRRHVLVQDEVDADEPVQITWNLHTQAQLEVSGDSATLTLADAHLLARIIEPPDARFEAASAQPPAPQNPNKGVRKLVIRLTERKGPLRLAVLLSPYRDHPPAFRPVVRPLSEWAPAGD